MNALSWEKKRSAKPNHSPLVYSSSMSFFIEAKQKYGIWFRMSNLYNNPRPLLKHSYSCGLRHHDKGPVFHFLDKTGR